MLLVQFFELGHFRHAGRAPSSPAVDQHHLTPQVSTANGLAVHRSQNELVSRSDLWERQYLDASLLGPVEGVVGPDLPPFSRQDFDTQVIGLASGKRLGVQAEADQPRVMVATAASRL